AAAAGKRLPGPDADAGEAAGASRHRGRAVGELERRPGVTLPGHPAAIHEEQRLARLELERRDHVMTEAAFLHDVVDQELPVGEPAARGLETLERGRLDSGLYLARIATRLERGLQCPLLGRP